MHATHTFTALVSLLGLAGVMAWRVREGRTPVTARKLLIPPAGMATGFSMFLFPAFRVPLAWGLMAVALGASVLAWPLLATSSLRRQGDTIWMKRSGAFFAVVVVLAVVRFAARDYFDRFLTMQQTGGLFYLLAFGMIVHWRAKLYLAYRSLLSQPPMNPQGIAAD